MDGWTYERKCADFLSKIGFIDVNVTRGSNDDGVDIVAIYDGNRYAIQCKYYEGKVGKKAISEVYAGSKSSKYKCDKCLVMTNSIFTDPAVEFAADLGVELIENIDAIVLGDSEKSINAAKKWRNKYNHSDNVDTKDKKTIPVYIGSFIDWRNQTIKRITKKKYEYYDSVNSECLKDFNSIKSWMTEYEKYYYISQNDYKKIGEIIKIIYQKFSISVPEVYEYLQYIEEHESEEYNCIKRTRLKEEWTDTIKYRHHIIQRDDSKVLPLDKWISIFDTSIRLKYKDEPNSNQDIIRDFETIKDKMVIYKNEYNISKDDLIIIRKMVLFLHGRLTISEYEMIEYGRYLKGLIEVAPNGKSERKKFIGS